MQEEISRVTPGYEETERRTPKVGYILLIAMFVAALFFGWRAIDDLQNVPQKPEQLSSCASPFRTYSWEDSWRGYYDYQPLQPYSYEPPRLLPIAEEVVPEKPGCAFSSYEKKYGIPAVFEKRKKLNDALSASSQALYNIASQLPEAERQYNLGLQEKIAREEKQLYPIPATSDQIESTRAQKIELEAKVAGMK
ncbi:MAG: hypothetical protein HYZ69_01035, partial [Candidatus Colwellbacteria bacterium]|nr:hypothetical protein [Candidatus Colwellbacteria bacterium]